VFLFDEKRMDFEGLAKTCFVGPRGDKCLFAEEKKELESYFASTCIRRRNEVCVAAFEELGQRKELRIYKIEEVDVIDELTAFL